MGLLEGKKAIVFGVANEKSIAWAIAQAFKAEGAEVALTYPNDAVRKRIEKLSDTLGVKETLPCDVRNDAEVAAVFSRLKEVWGGLDILVHSVAFANKEELKGSFLNTTREGFATALDISAYSLVALAKEAIPLMEGRDGSILTLSYYGAQKVFPSYNVMGVAKAALEASVRYLAEAAGPLGVRVNAISAGPLKTLAASGVGGFNQIARHIEDKAPMRRTITQEEVADAALYLCSRMARGVTGEIHFVDSGYNIIGM